MDKKLFFALSFMVVTGILFFTGCPENGDSASYTLTVTLGNGVTGTPAAGSYTHSEDETVNFSYSAQSGYGNLAVTLDGAPVASSGAVGMTTNHTLDATALIDVRGTWTGLAQNPQGGGGENYFFECTFSGGVLSGSVHGRIESLGNANGTYTVNGNELTFTLNYSGIMLTCTGTFTSPNYVNGDWDWPEVGSHQTGTWHLER
jgi:hypothetical protein